MKTCSGCGAIIAENHAFCGKCGHPVRDTETAAGTSVNAAQQNKKTIPDKNIKCSKCATSMERGVMYCPSCGTRMFSGTAGTKDELLMVFAGSELSFRAPGMGNTGTLYVYDNKLLFKSVQQTDFSAAVSSIDSISRSADAPGVLGMTVDGRGLIISLNGRNADSAQYLMELIRYKRNK